MTASVRPRQSIVFHRAGGHTIATIPETLVEGDTDRDAIQAVIDTAQSVISGANAMLSKCDRITGEYKGAIEPVQPFRYEPPKESVQ